MSGMTGVARITRPLIHTSLSVSADTISKHVVVEKHGANTSWVQLSHIDRWKPKRSDFIHPSHNFRDLFISVYALHSFHAGLLIHIRGFQHEILQYLIHGRNHFLRVFEQLRVDLFSGGVSEEVDHIQVQVGVACLSHSTHVSLV
jgi:hypothetical protein